MKKFISYVIIIYSIFFLIIELTYNFPKTKTAYSFLFIKEGIISDTLIVSSDNPASHSNTTSTSIVYKGKLSSNNKVAQITLSNTIYPYFNERHKDYSTFKPNKIVVYHSNLSSHFLFYKKSDNFLSLGLTYFIDPILFLLSIFLIANLIFKQRRNINNN